MRGSSRPRRATGADVLVCLVSLGCLMRGIGDDLSPLSVPRFPCVLVNPRKSVPTPAVFDALGLKPGQPGKAAPALSVAASVSLETIRTGRNDLEGVACRLEPMITEVLDALSVTQGIAVARMSGSGATCFGLYTDAMMARSAADALSLVHPEWWVWSGGGGGQLPSLVLAGLPPPPRPGHPDLGLLLKRDPGQARCVTAICCSLCLLPPRSSFARHSLMNAMNAASAGGVCRRLG